MLKFPSIWYWYIHSHIHNILVIYHGVFIVNSIVCLTVMSDHLVKVNSLPY